MLVIFSLVSLLWAIYGYSFAFTEGNAFFGGTDRLFMKGLTVDAVAATFSKGVVVPELAYFAFQLAFAAITCALIIGAFAERAKFSAVLLFVVLWFTFSYLPIAHMVWFWPGPDAYTDAAAGAAATARAAGCSRRVRSTTPAARWCTSTPRSRARSVPSCSASVSALAVRRSARTA